MEIFPLSPYMYTATQTILTNWSLEPSLNQVSIPTQSWYSLIDPQNKHVYLYKGSSWLVHKFRRRSRTHIAFYAEIPFIPSEDKNHFLPVSIDTTKPDNLKALPFGNRTQNLRQVPPTIKSSFLSYLHSRPSTEQWIIGHVLQLSPSELHTFALSISYGTIIIGSDGSQNHGHSSYSFLIQSTEHPQIYIQSHFLIQLCTVFSAEGYGHLAALYILPVFAFFFSMNQKQFSVPSHNDNKSLTN